MTPVQWMVDSSIDKGQGDTPGNSCYHSDTMVRVHGVRDWMSKFEVRPLRGSYVVSAHSTCTTQAVVRTAVVRKLSGLLCAGGSIYGLRNNTAGCSMRHRS